MSEQEIDQFHDTFRSLEDDFAARPDHRRPGNARPPRFPASEVKRSPTSGEQHADEAAAAERRAAQVKEWYEQQKRMAWKDRMKKVMAVTALLATVKGGGFIDMAGDAMSDAGDVTAGVIERAELDVPGVLDGVKLEDYPEASQKEIVAEQTEAVERYNVARETIVDLFRQIDSQGTSQVVAEVGYERSQHPELFATSEVVDSTREAIDSAATNKAALMAFSGFMNTYDIKAGFYDTPFEDKQDETKKILNAYIDVFSVLPKDFIQLARLERVTVSNASHTAQPGNYPEAGSYSEYDSSIDVVVPGNVELAMMPVGEFLAQEDGSYQGVIAHELGHALDAQLILTSDLDENETVESDTTDASTFFSQIGENVINRPNHISYYSHTSKDEHTAELLSGLLSDRSNGLASPDEWRRFGSGANKAMIRMLVDLEIKRPGIAKILLANRAS